MIGEFNVSANNSELLGYYRREIKFQSDLLSSRLSSLLTSQSFLLIAYASAMSGLIGHWQDPFALVFPPVLAVLGLVLCLQAWPGIRAGYAVIALWHCKEREVLVRDSEVNAFDYLPAPQETADEPDRWINERSEEGALFTKQAPLVFTVTWCYFAVLPFGMYVLA
jgi:hypothetical protein